MKRMLFIFFLCLITSGCAIFSPTETFDETLPATTIDFETEPTTVEETTQAQVSVPLFPYEYGQYLDDTHILAQISNTAIENTSYPSLRLLDGQPLIFSPDFADDGSVTLTLKLLDLTSDTVLNEVVLPLSTYFIPLVNKDTVVVSDPVAGHLYVYDRNLNLANTLTFSSGSDLWQDWYLSSDQQYLFCLDGINGLTVTEIASGEKKTLLDATAQAYQIGVCGSSVSFAYVDPDTHLNSVGYLDLDTNTFTPCPFNIELNSLSICDGFWVGQIFGNSSYLIATEEESLTTNVEHGQLFMIAPTKHLLVTVYSTQMMYLYDADGTFLSSCSLASLGRYASPTTELCWSEADGGYFFTIYGENDIGQLLFWDVSIPVEGEDLPLVPLDMTQDNGGETAELEHLYDRAKLLSETYDVNIRIADQCDSTYTDFDAVIVYDADMLSWALNDLEAVLATYPSGFFSQLRYEHVREIEINLVGTLTATNDYYDNGSYNAFAEPIGNKHRIVLDIYTSSRDTIHHELSHVIDKKLEWDANRREDALYSEDQWLSLSPDGFEYLYVYDANWDANMRPEWSGYFIDGYAVGFPTEDRARVWEYALGGYDWYFEDAPGLQAKLRYYSECIRDCFDTTGWPEVLPWERLLSE